MNMKMLVLSKQLLNLEVMDAMKMMNSIKKIENTNFYLFYIILIHINRYKTYLNCT